MITLIHASHRHGYCWLLIQKLKEQFANQTVDVQLVDLTAENIEYCCGGQYCQETSCIHSDGFTSHLMQPLLESRCVFLVTPTYFDMPPARLKNMIDRSNAVLPHISKEISRYFGVWAIGELETASILSNVEALKTYASVLGMQVTDELIRISVVKGGEHKLTETDVYSVSEITTRILSLI